MKLREFAQQHGLTLESVKLLGRRDSGPKWEAHHYQCRLTVSANRREFLFDYSKGAGLVRKAKGYERRGGVDTVPEEPQLVECLDCLHSDANSVAHGQRFEEWAGDVGYETDSRTAYNVYHELLRQQTELWEMMGPAVYHEFLGCEGE